jgi:hypothetical protein
MTSTTAQPGMVAVAISGAKTLRRDRWWVEPLITVVVLGLFTVYATWAALANADYYVEPYLSPFYSPCLATSCAHGTVELFGDWWSLSPALLILPFPLGFRLTCYYYRKAYYRAFFWSPPACAVQDARARYTGESRFPLILQNVHRVFFYLILPFPILLLWDALRAFDLTPCGPSTSPTASGWASAPSSCWPTPSCSGSTCCPAIPAATSAAGGSTACRTTALAMACGSS